MADKVLITGASGLIGKRLKFLLKRKGYLVNTIGRQSKTETRTQNHFTWDVANMTMDEEALYGVSTIIHLAGAGVADKRWTAERKQEILISRVASTQLLYNTLKLRPHTVKAVIAASAVGYYGDCGAELVTEEHPPADTFLAEVCKAWESEVIKFKKIGLREVRARIGIVLAKGGGALPELYKTVPFGVAGYFSKSPLYYPWIHIDDVCRIMIHAIENTNVSGAYNTCAPTALELKDLMKAIVKGSGKKALVIPAPPFAIQLAMGEMAEMLLSSQKCSAEKIIATGFNFSYTDATKAVAAELQP